MDVVSFSDGNEMPVLGLGTYRLMGRECTDVVLEALDLGYRHFDTADFYANHRELGIGLRQHSREDLFVATKLRPVDFSPETILATCERYLKELGLDYLDLLLLHWPASKRPMRAVLEELVKLKEKGLIRSMGVSNFTTVHLDQFLDLPIVNNQVECHPHLVQDGLMAYCQENNIVISAYSPLCVGAIPDDSVLVDIAEAHGKSVAQVCLRYLFQLGIPSIPKASSSEHLRDNLAIFDFVLSEEEMIQIKGVNNYERLCQPDCNEFDIETRERVCT